ncbi:UNVERIFIED_CONTAM: hypothetical protein NY603_34725, partial [Bacteroidetes bacterium 56_B9]
MIEHVLGMLDRIRLSDIYDEVTPLSLLHRASGRAVTSKQAIGSVPNTVKSEEFLVKSAREIKVSRRNRSCGQDADLFSR